MDDEEVKLALMTNNGKLLAGISSCYRFSDGTRLVHWASMYNNVFAFDKAIGDGEDVDRAGGVLDSTPLYYALYNSNYRMMQLLLENGANSSYVNKSGLGLLHTCARFDDVLGMILLLCYGADADVKDFKGRTVLEYAKAKKKRRVMKFLKSRAAAGWRDTVGVELLLIGAHLVFLVLGTWYRVGLIVILLSIWKNVVYTKFPIYLNLFYTSYLGYRSLRRCPNLTFQVLCYLHVLARLLLRKPRFASKNTHVESRELVLMLVERNEYSLDNFCYICLAQKTGGLGHCSICNRCILDFDHHCPCVGRCIDKKTLVLFNNYVATALTTTVMVFLFGDVSELAVELVLVTAFVMLVMYSSTLGGTLHETTTKFIL